MTYNEFIVKKEKLKLSFSQFAELIGYTPDAVKKWKNKEEVPKWVTIVLSYLEISQKIKKDII